MRFGMGCCCTDNNEGGTEKKRRRGWGSSATTAATAINTDMLKEIITSSVTGAALAAVVHARCSVFSFFSLGVLGSHAD